MHASRDRALHERVIGRVVFDLVDAPAGAIVGPQLRSVPIRECDRYGHVKDRSFCHPDQGSRISSLSRTLGEIRH